MTDETDHDVDVVDEAPAESPSGTVVEVDEDDDVVGQQPEQPAPTTTDPIPATQLTFIDHFSLRGPSSTVRFRGTKTTIYEQGGENQFIMEERVEDDGHHHITAKSMRNGSFGLQVLRVGYTLVAVLMMGFLFVLCFQVLLFLFVNLPVTVGETALSSIRPEEFIGTVLSIPLFLHSMGSVMAYASTFVTDTWNGHKLFRDMMEWPEMLEEWLAFVIFLAVPTGTILVTLLMELDRWWEISSYTWMVCVFTFFLFFSVVTLQCEVGACWETVALLEQRESGGSAQKLPWWKLLQRSVLWTQRQRFAGVREERYLVHGGDAPPSSGYAMSPDHTPEQTRTHIYTRLTTHLLTCGPCPAFETLETPRRVYSVEEIRDIVPFVTRANWSLETTFCLSPNDKVVYAMTGPQALELNQAQSSLVCTGIGLVILTLLLVGALVWLGSPAPTVVVFALILFYCCAFPTIQSSWNVFRTYQELRSVEDTKARGKNRSIDEEEVADVLYQVWETVAVTKPKDWYCWMRTSIDFFFLFLWPFVVLGTTEQYPILVMFFFLGIFSALRIYCNASFVLSELGCLSDLNLYAGNSNEVENEDVVNTSVQTERSGRVRRGTDKSLLAKARTSSVIGNITRSRVAGRWRILYTILALGILFLFALAADEEVTTPKGGRPPIVQLQDFYYPQQPNLPYPSCKMTNTFAIPGPNETAARLGDFSYLAALAYETEAVAQHYLDTWFGEDQLVDESDFVTEWREETGTDENPVYFKLYSIRDLPGYGIVAIRGSQTKTDFLVDAQLWSSAFLAQIVQAFIPLGWIWTSILDDLVRVVNFVESGSIKKVAYYKVTTAFVNDVLENKWSSQNGTSFHTLRITGASLGGGLAIITGAQTRANAIAISGLNGRLSRRTFEPQVTEEDLDTRVFNVIPDRDIIAVVGDRSRLFQEIQCRAPLNSLFGCHSMWRTACELSYVCGTENRPVMCQCVEKFGYPEPMSSGNRTFAEACREELSNLEVALPGSFQTSNITSTEEEGSV